MYLKINDTVFTIEEQEAYTILELLRNVVIPKVETNAENIKTLQDGIEQIESELDGVQTKLVQIGTAVTTNAGNIQKLRNDVDHILTVDIVDLNSQITGLKSRMTNVETATNTNATSINTINNITIPGMMEEISNTQTDLSTAKSQINQNTQNINSNLVQINALKGEKYDNATITNENTLNFFANNVLKKSLTLPAGGGGGGSGTTIEHIQVLTSNNEPVNAFMMKNSEYALIFLCDICNFPSTNTFTLPENLRSNYFLSTGNYTNGEGKVMQAGKLKEIYIVVNSAQRSEIKIMGDGAMPVQVGANAFIWAWFMLKLTEG